MVLSSLTPSATESFFALGCEDIQGSLQMAMARGVSEGCSFTCDLISPHLTPYVVPQVPRKPGAGTLLPEGVHLEEAIALPRWE